MGKCDLQEDLPTYISFDVDALDPAYTPGTGTPEVREPLCCVSGVLSALSIFWFECGVWCRSEV